MTTAKVTTKTTVNSVYSGIVGVEVAVGLLLDRIVAEGMGVDAVLAVEEDVAAGVAVGEGLDVAVTVCVVIEDGFGSWMVYEVRGA